MPLGATTLVNVNWSPALNCYGLPPRCWDMCGWLWLSVLWCRWNGPFVYHARPIDRNFWYSAVLCSHCCDWIRDGHGKWASFGQGKGFYDADGMRNTSSNMLIHTHPPPPLICWLIYGPPHVNALWKQANCGCPLRFGCVIKSEKKEKQLLKIWNNQFTLCGNWTHNFRLRAVNEIYFDLP